MDGLHHASAPPCTCSSPAFSATPPAAPLHLHRSVTNPLSTVRRLPPWRRGAPARMSYVGGPRAAPPRMPPQEAFSYSYSETPLSFSTLLYSTHVFRGFSALLHPLPTPSPHLLPACPPTSPTLTHPCPCRRRRRLAPSVGPPPYRLPRLLLPPPLRGGYSGGVVPPARGRVCLCRGGPAAMRVGPRRTRRWRGWCRRHWRVGACSQAAAQRRAASDAVPACRPPRTRG